MNKNITAEDIGGFDPIPDLKPGDKVTWKSKKVITDRFPAFGETVTVHSTEVAQGSRDQGEYIRRDDFTLLFDDGNEESSIREFAFDSRRFKRVE